MMAPLPRRSGYCVLTELTMRHLFIRVHMYLSDYFQFAKAEKGTQCPASEWLGEIRAGAEKEKRKAEEGTGQGDKQKGRGEEGSYQEQEAFLIMQTEHFRVMCARYCSTFSFTM